MSNADAYRAAFLAAARRGIDGQYQDDGDYLDLERVHGNPDGPDFTRSTVTYRIDTGHLSCTVTAINDNENERPDALHLAAPDLARIEQELARA